jgi:zinc transporter ZupT
MLTTFQFVCLLCIFAATIAGGYYPLVHRDTVLAKGGLPLAEAFTCGVFLALALTMMLPPSLDLLSKAYPGFDFPTGALIAAVAFMALLAMEHQIEHLRNAAGISSDVGFPPLIPVTMTVMIAVPSFFLGTALGVSDTDAAVLIFIAIMLHKSSAAFALTLQMARSTMSTPQSWATFLLFACATPAGIIVGQEIHQWMGPDTMGTVKGVVLGLAAGTFLFIATLHDLKHAPMITRCTDRRGFTLMLIGFLLTVGVRVMIGEAHAPGI